MNAQVGRISAANDTERRHYRTVWISDIHLGTRGCNAALLVDFLDHVDCDHMYLVGDIIDGWRLKKRFYWPTGHNDVVWRIMKRAKRGTRVVYIPGNHDEMFRQFAGMDFGGVKIRKKAIQQTAAVGDAAYTWLMRVNTVVNKVRTRMGLPYWSLSKMAKHKVKNAVAFINRFEEVVAHEAGARGVDGVVCGHIHNAEIREIDGVTYYNDGDWVESCTALVEHADGMMEILHWGEIVAARTKVTKLLPAPLPAPVAASHPRPFPAAA